MDDRSSRSGDACGRVPNFFILGAAKSGTTSLAKYLAQHPEIYIPRVKETYFFSSDAQYAKGLDWYSRTYYAQAASATAVGDATPVYLLFEKAAVRIAADLDASALRFIVMMRDPVARAHSLYWHLYRDDYETLSFEAALENETERTGTQAWHNDGHGLYAYYSGGLYAQQIEKYLRHFGRESFLFVNYNELKDAQSLCERVFSFLGVRMDVRVRVETHNAATLPRFRAVKSLMRSPWLAAAGRALVPSSYRFPLREAVRRLNSRPFSYPRILPQTEAQLRLRYVGELSQLKELTGVDLLSQTQISEP